MPNHIHVIICIDTVGADRVVRPTAADAAFQIHYHTAGLEHGIYKALATLYYDHAIRNDAVISAPGNTSNNPARWAEDEYYRNKEKRDHEKREIRQMRPLRQDMRPGPT